MGFQVFISVNIHNMSGRVTEGGVCLNKYTSKICRINAEAAVYTATLTKFTKPHGVTSQKTIIFFSVLLPSN
jgi:hypothetical protein